MLLTADSPLQLCPLAARRPMDPRTPLDILVNFTLPYTPVTAMILASYIRITGESIGADIAVASAGRPSHRSGLSPLVQRAISRKRRKMLKGAQSSVLDVHALSTPYLASGDSKSAN